jgi:ribosome-associated protein
MPEDGQDNAEQTTTPALGDAELLAQCDVDTFRSGGPGGQHQNVTDSGVRLRHRPSGIVVTCRRTRSQHLNKQECLDRLRRRLEERERPVTPRLPTKPSRSSQERRLAEKARRAALKRERGTAPEDE